MPDTEIDEQGAEHDQEAEAAFEEEDGAVEEKPVEKDGGGTDGKDAEGGEEKEESAEEGEAEPETAEQRALKRAEALAGGDGTDKEFKEGGGDKENEDGGKEKSAVATLTKEQVGEFLSIIGESDLPAKPVIIGDQEVDLAKYAKEYPDEFNSNVVLAGIIAKKMVEKQLKSSGYVSAEDHQKTTAALNDEIVRLNFWGEVMEFHPDARKIAKSDEFKTWMAEQPRKIQMLGQRNNAEDAVAMLDFYKEDLAKKALKKKDDEDKGKKTKKDALLGGGVRAKPTAPKEKPGSDDNPEEAFNEAADAIANSRKR